MKNDVIEAIYTDKKKTVYDKEDAIRDLTDRAIEKIKFQDDSNKNLDQITKEILWLKDKTTDFFIMCIDKLENLYKSGKWRASYTRFEIYLKERIGISYNQYNEKLQVSRLVKKYPKLRARVDEMNFDHSKIRGLIPLMNNNEIPESEKNDIVDQASEFIVTCTTREINEKIKEIKSKFTGKTREDIEREKIENAQKIPLTPVVKTAKMIEAENTLFAKENYLLVKSSLFLAELGKINLGEFVIKEITKASEGQKKQIDKNLLDIENMIRSFSDHLDYFKKINSEA